MMKNKCPTLIEFLPIHATIYHHKSLGISGDGMVSAPPHYCTKKNESLSRTNYLKADSSYYLLSQIPYCNLLFTCI